MEELLGPKELRPLLSVSQLATWLGMSVPWVYKAVEKGIIPFLRIGEAIRFDAEEIRAYLESRRDLIKTYGQQRNPKKKPKQSEKP